MIPEVALLVAVGLGAAGCESPEATAQRRAGEGSLATAPESFRAEVTLCRRVSRKSGEPIGAGDSFVMRERSRVNALVDFRNLHTNRVHSVHLVWIAPDGREIYRKYAEITLRPAAEGGYETRILWREAEDLNTVEEEMRRSAEPALQLWTAITTSLDRGRDPGPYALRVYLDRRLLVEEPFELVLGA
jgi:hypothetical protein